MKPTTAVIFIMLSFIYFPGTRTNDEALSNSTDSKIEKASSTEGEASSNPISSEIEQSSPTEGTSDETKSSSSTTTSHASSSSEKTSLSTKPYSISASAATLQPLPEGTDTFDSIRSKKKLFVDKTPFMKGLIEENGALYVITRPKRFGKSVFLQMMRRFLEGTKELFENTEIASRGNGLKEGEGWNPYPVIYLDFHDIPSTETVEDFRDDLRKALQDIAKAEGLPIQGKLNIGRLIKDLKEKYNGLPVSILIDNYDEPLSGNSTISRRNRADIQFILSRFYEQIRANVDNLRLALTFGVSMLIILSNGQSRFKDLTMDKRFSSVVGFDSEEVEKYLKPYIQDFIAKGYEKSKIKKFAEKQNEIKTNLKKFYGGYQFAREEVNKMLNPASTCDCLREKEFGNKMGNAALIPIVRKMMIDQNKKMEDFELYRMKGSELKEYQYDPDKIPVHLFMLCNGFLTRVDYNRMSDTLYLGYPNDETRLSLKGGLEEELIGENMESLSRLGQCLAKNDIAGLVYFLNYFNFRDDMSKSLKRADTAEFTCTKLIVHSLNSADVECAEGQLLYAMNEKNVGDVDFIAKTPTSQHVTEVKYDHSALKGLLQLICYIIENASAFLEVINLDKDIFLVAMNIKSSTTGTNETMVSIDEWVCVPYRNRTIRVDEFSSSSNLDEEFIHGLKDALKQKSTARLIDYLDSTIIVFPQNK